MYVCMYVDAINLNQVGYLYNITYFYAVPSFPSTVALAIFAHTSSTVSRGLYTSHFPPVTPEAFAISVKSNFLYSNFKTQAHLISLNTNPSIYMLLAMATM